MSSSHTNDESSSFPSSEVQHEHLNEAEVEQEISNPPPLVVQRPQPSSEKVGAGILIRNLRKGGPSFNNSNNREHDEELDFELLPNPGDTVKIHYEAFLYKDDGTNTIQERPFDSSRRRNQPFCFVLGKEQVIDGLDVAVEQMKLGQLVEVTMPYLYAYGEQGYLPQIPPKSTLVFHIELLDFTSGDVITDKKWHS